MLRGTSSTDYALTETSLEVRDESMNRERWEYLLGEFAPAERSASWHIGDLLAFGFADDRPRWGDGTYAAAVAATGFSPGSLRNLAWVSRAVPPKVRRPELSWRAHRQVAGIKDPREQGRWLGRAADAGWTSDELRRKIALVKVDVDDGESEFPDVGGEPERCPECGQVVQS